MKRASNRELCETFKRQMTSVADASRGNDVAVVRMRELWRQFRHIEARMCPLEDLARRKGAGEDISEYS